MMNLARARPEEARRLMRAGELGGVTSGLCLGYLQANLAILPAEAAAEFRDFCLANPRPLPLIDVTEPGDPTPRRVAPGADLRTDLPRYRVYHQASRWPRSRTLRACCASASVRHRITPPLRSLTRRATRPSRNPRSKLPKKSEKSRSTTHRAPAFTSCLMHPIA